MDTAEKFMISFMLLIVAGTAWSLVNFSDHFSDGRKLAKSMGCEYIGINQTVHVFDCQGTIVLKRVE